MILIKRNEAAAFSADKGGRGRPPKIESENMMTMITTLRTGSRGKNIDIDIHAGIEDRGSGKFRPWITLPRGPLVPGSTYFPRCRLMTRDRATKVAEALVEAHLVVLFLSEKQMVEDGDD